MVNGGQSRAVVGARVYVLQANTSNNGDPSVSLLTSATGNPADSIGHYAITGEFGGFTIACRYTCTPGRQVYVYARGGDSGDNGANSAIGLMASLGTCPASGSFAGTAPFIFVNEVTTVAAAYAMAGRATDPIHVTDSAGPDNDEPLAQAANLANIVTGFANAALPTKPESKVPRSKIHTLANILSACVNSSGPASNGCTTLFANARSSGATGTIPTDTAAAAINIARNPRANIAALYGLQPRIARPFEPALESAPPDFTISLESEEAKTTVASLAPRP